MADKMVQKIYKHVLKYVLIAGIISPKAGFESGIYDSLLLEFAVAHKPTQPPRLDGSKYLYDSFFIQIKKHSQSLRLAATILVDYTSKQI